MMRVDPTISENTVRELTLDEVDVIGGGFQRVYFCSDEPGLMRCVEAPPDCGCGFAGCCRP